MNRKTNKSSKKQNNEAHDKKSDTLTDQRKYPWWFYIILFTIPFFFLLMTEVALRIFSFGNDYIEWIDLDDKYEILNPEIGEKYFSGIKNVPFSTESFLLRNKPDNSLRVFVLGASSGAGYPYQNSASFSKYIRKALKAALPSKKIEVCNISMAAINSFTVLDLLPGIIEKKPDIILIYLGHNEYYGVLGAASKQSFVNSTRITNLILKLKNVRLYQLLENIIFSLGNLTSKDHKNADETLMATIASEKAIEINSELYFDGLNQYEENLSSIMQICMNSNIPVIVGTLTSNLKDQKPFISIASEKSSSADDIYEEALFNFRDGYIVKADSLFRNAKDLDGLRFRAPEVFNKIIRKLSGKFNAQIADIDFYLKKASEAGIIGNDLMTDHLHPNVIGYQLMGKLFTEKILQSKLFYHDSVNINIDSIHSQVLSNFHFTKYDSIISDFRIKILKNDWPFIERDKKIAKNELFQINSIEGEIAQGVLDGNISRLEARIELIEHYTESGEYIPVAEHLLSLVDEFPNQKEILNNYTAKLISLKKYQLTERLLETSYFIEPDAFNTKWLGIMFISNNNFTKAIKFLTESINFNPNDPQIFFNLSGAYFQKKDYLKSYHYINKCLEISPSYRNALSFKLNLEKLLKN